MDVLDYERNREMNRLEAEKIQKGAAGRLKESIIDLVENYAVRGGAEALREVEVKARLLNELEYGS